MCVAQLSCVRAPAAMTAVQGGSAQEAARVNPYARLRSAVLSDFSQNAVEYVLLIALIALVVVGTVRTTGAGFGGSMHESAASRP